MKVVDQIDDAAKNLPALLEFPLTPRSTATIIRPKYWPDT
jgi:hypothetical protein